MERRRRLLLALLVALVPLIPIALALAIPGGGGSAAATTAATTTFKPVAPVSKLGRHPARTGTLVALLQRPATLDSAPAGHVLARLALRTQFGSPQAMAVAATRPGWVGVLSPQAGNGRIGWLPRSDVELGRVSWWIGVSLDTRTITVRDGKRTVAHFRTAVGRDGAPTPTGVFAVTDRLLTGDPSGPYGCCIVALSAVAPHAIADWDGGDRIAIHSTPEVSSIGQAASHGCLRISSRDAAWLLAHVPLGTPVTIAAGRPHPPDGQYA